MSTLLPPDDDALEALARRALRGLPDAPAAWVQAATALWPQPATAAANPAWSALQAQAQAGAQRLLRGLQAVLRFDSWHTPALAAGMRQAGAAQGAPRQLVYSAEDHDIDLRISAAADQQFSVAGQVLGPEAECVVALQAERPDGAGAADAFEAPLDALGEFRFDHLPAGRWRVQLRLPDRLIALPTIELGGGAPPG